MGSPEDVGDSNEHPQKEVAMTSFWMGQTEVSRGDIYSEFGKPLWHFDLIRMIELLITVDEITESYCGEMNGKGDDYPVVCLTMQEKRDYCQAQGGDLPTAAQFEYAARFDEQDAQPEQLIVWDNGYGSTVPVTTGYQNRFGIFNLLGNVWESMRDAYDENFYSRMPGTDPYNPLTNPYDYTTNRDGQFEEIRGGSFDGDRRYARPADRYVVDPDGRRYSGGFRCAGPADSK